MGSSIVYTEYLDGFQYSTPNTEPLRMALEEQDDETVSVAKAANIETFSPLENRAKIIAPPQPAEPIMVLSFFPTTEGFYDCENLRYIYQYKDHFDKREQSATLGEDWERSSVRVSYVKDGSSLKVMDTNDYYPFGMSFTKSNHIAVYDPLSVPYNYKYNGKELQETGMYDYQARQLMVDVPGFLQIDPLAEKMPWMSPYAYAFNNPIRNTDPIGMEPEDNIGGGNENCCSGPSYVQFQQEAYKWFDAGGHLINKLGVKAEGFITTIGNIVKGDDKGTIETKSTATLSVDGNFLRPTTYTDENGFRQVKPMSNSPIKFSTKSETTINKTYSIIIPTEAGTIKVSNKTSVNKNNGKVSNTTKAVYGAGDNGLFTSLKGEKNKLTTSIGLQAEHIFKNSSGGIKIGVNFSANIETEKKKK